MYKARSSAPPEKRAGVEQEQASAFADALEDEILREHFTRNIQFFGPESQDSVFKAFVAVIGLGGVGSHAACLLARSGVGKLRLIDFDQVSLSSLNRHAVATRADVGLSKPRCLKEHIARIVPEAKVDAQTAMFTADTADSMLGGGLDYVLDAIDNIDTKIALLAACKQRGIPVISAAGAGKATHPLPYASPFITIRSACQTRHAG
ncbi:hypothetical protein WJX73_001168 [Symbiochloris irregularis]|uniref:THIF-type NAD/FAD binding fold domain-containing protein n=1 Tax=Symbiochloris irregularis TaxID=706552 RepID=A0AAW1PU88_9CHLO